MSQSETGIKLKGTKTKMMVSKCCGCKETLGCKAQDGNWEKFCIVDCLAVLDCVLLETQEPTDKIGISYAFCEICFNDRFKVPAHNGNKLLPGRER